MKMKYEYRRGGLGPSCLGLEGGDFHDGEPSEYHDLHKWYVGREGTCSSSSEASSCEMVFYKSDCFKGGARLDEVPWIHHCTDEDTPDDIQHGSDPTFFVCFFLLFCLSVDHTLFLLFFDFLFLLPISPPIIASVSNTASASSSAKKANRFTFSFM